MDGPSEKSIRRQWESLSPATTLYTSDNQPLTVLSPGKPNSDAGPDYVNALIRLDGRLYRGDVEVHGNERDWLQHGHHLDPHYNMVVLHVVGHRSGRLLTTQTAGKRTIPTLVLAASGPACATVLNTEPACACRVDLDAITHPDIGRAIHRILRDLGWRWFERRVLTLQARLDELLRDAQWQLRETARAYDAAGRLACSSGHSWTKGELDSDEVWDQLLYEGVVEGLGYAKNKTAFRTLAQNLPLSVLRRIATKDHETLCAVLLGAAGLLPSSRRLQERESRQYVVRLRRRWRELQKALRCPIMHEAEWLFFRLRPVNFPTARISVLGYLLPRLLDAGVLRKLIGRLAEPDLTSAERQEQLRQFFAITPAGFWSTHLHFRGHGSGPSVFLGIHRIDAIIFNTLLPLVVLRARLFNDRTLSATAISMVRVMAAIERNSITRKIEQEVLKGSARLDTALLQHGAIELNRRFCMAGRCPECPLGPSRTAGRPEF